MLPQLQSTYFLPMLSAKKSLSYHLFSESGLHLCYRSVNFPFLLFFPESLLVLLLFLQAPNDLLRHVLFSLSISESGLHLCYRSVNFPFLLFFPESLLVLLLFLQAPNDLLRHVLFSLSRLPYQLPILSLLSFCKLPFSSVFSGVVTGFVVVFTSSQ